MTTTNIEQEILKKYQDLSVKHKQCAYNIISTSSEFDGADMNLVGIIDGFNSILVDVNNIQDTDFINSKQVCESIISIIEKEEDKIKTLILISKLCSELLLQIPIASEIKNN